MLGTNFLIFLERFTNLIRFFTKTLFSEFSEIGIFFDEILVIIDFVHENVE